MEENELYVLVENELYMYILALSEDKIEKVTIERIEEGILWFLLKYDKKIGKEQRHLIIEKTWKMFENKNKNLTVISKEKHKEEISKIEEIDI